VFGCWPSGLVLVRGCGPSCMRKPFWLGGTTRVMVLDNLRTGVLSPDIYDAGLNPLNRDVLVHLGVTAQPCKVRDPDRKGKVESGVNHAQMTLLKGRNSKVWSKRRRIWTTGKSTGADKCIHGRTKRQVAAMFADEKSFLQTLPLEPFHHYQYGEGAPEWLCRT
jgi:hypothetical protein